MNDIQYILVGGYPHKALDGGKAFYTALTEGFVAPVKVLICLFSRPKDNWTKAFEQDKAFFENNLPDIEVDIKCATEENFLEEIKWADSIYFRGGETDLLLERLSKYKDWISLLNKKTVAGSSAGAYMLSKYYYDIVTMDIKNGLGITNTKVIVHWKSDEYKVEWEKAFLELEAYTENLPLLKLAEGEFSEINLTNQK